MNLQRQLPGHTVASATCFLILGHQHFTKESNAIDPHMEEQFQNALTVTVPSPFCYYLTPFHSRVGYGIRQM